MGEIYPNNSIVILEQVINQSRAALINPTPCQIDEQNNHRHRTAGRLINTHTSADRPTVV